MRITIGSDHAGFELKQALAEYIKSEGHEVIDVGTHDTKSVDYPDFAEAVGNSILQGKCDRAVLICGSGVGASVAANKVRGVRAGLCHDHYSAHQGVEHDDMNVLVMGARVIGIATAQELVSAYLGANYTHEERHQRRLDKVNAIENRSMAPAGSPGTAAKGA